MTDFMGRVKLPDIPSEFIEPYLAQFMSYEIECVATGYRKPQEARNNLKAIDLFISRFGGLHSKYAVMNEYNKMISLSDEDMINICKKCYDA
jgi:hypothetical protein